MTEVRKTIGKWNQKLNYVEMIYSSGALKR